MWLNEKSIDFLCQNEAVAFVASTRQIKNHQAVKLSRKFYFVPNKIQNHFVG